MANGTEGERHPGNGSHGAQTPGGADGSPSESTRRFASRRRVLRTGAAAAASGLAFSGTAGAEHYDDVSPADREVDGDACLDYGEDELYTGDAMVINNDWSTQDCPENVEMCISTYGDGSFGWEWSRGHTCEHGNDLPNYPQALMGQKIGATSSGWGGLPERNDNIERLDVQLDVEQDHSDGEWNFMLEWWMEEGQITGDPSDEILIVLDDSEWHDKGENVVTAAFEDDYGNVIDYWENDIEGGNGADWDFHIFRVQGDEVPSHIDLRSLLDYLVEDENGHVADGGGTYDGSKLVSGIEIGNETWDDTDGETIVDQFNVRVETTDGREQIGIAGVENQWSEPENLAPSAPTGLEVTDTSEDSVSLAWDAASDPDGTVSEYEVTSPSGPGATTSGTSATVSGLDPDATYEFSVVAVDDEGAESPASDAVTATTGSTGPCADLESMEVDGDTVCNVNGDDYYRDVNGDGNVGNRDVGAFFEQFHFQAYDRDEFDYSGNGRVSHGDVVALFDYVI